MTVARGYLILNIKFRIYTLPSSAQGICNICPAGLPTKEETAAFLLSRQWLLWRIHTALSLLGS